MPVPYSFDYCGFVIYFEIIVMLALFFLKIALVIQGLLQLHMNFTCVFFSYFCKKCHWYFIDDSIESVDHFGV